MLPKPQSLSTPGGGLKGAGKKMMDRRYRHLLYIMSRNLNYNKFKFSVVKKIVVKAF
jgi:hypothetical protein